MLAKAWRQWQWQPKAAAAKHGVSTSLVSINSSRKKRINKRQQWHSRGSCGNGKHGSWRKPAAGVNTAAKEKATMTALACGGVSGWHQRRRNGVAWRVYQWRQRQYNMCIISHLLTWGSP